MHAPAGGVLKALLRGLSKVPVVGRDVDTPLFCAWQLWLA